MTKGKRPIRKVCGAVLMMVVTIMFILVIMLLATLTVVSNANKRTIAKFEENQAYYTARSVQEVYVDEVLENEKSVSGKGSTIKQAWKQLGFSFDSPDDDPTKKNAYEENLDNNKDFAGADICEGFLIQQEIFSYLTPKYILVTDSNMGTGKTFTDDEIIIDDAGKIKTGKQVTENAYYIENPALNIGTTNEKSDYYIEYEAELPDVSNLTDNGRLVGLLDSDGKVTIRVELLKVAYQTSDGTLLYDGKYKFSDKVSSLTNPEDNVCDGSGMRMSKIDMGNLYYSIKVSATSKVANATGGFSERTVAVILEPGATPPVPGAPGRGAVSASSGSTNSDNIEVFGGISSNSHIDDDVFAPQNNNSFVGNAALTGYKEALINVSLNNWMLSKNEYFVVTDGYICLQNNGNYLVGRGKLDLSSLSDDEARIEQGKRPFTYSKGFVFNGNGACIGTNNKNGNDDGSFDCACDIITVANEDIQTDFSWLFWQFSSVDKSNAALVFAGQNHHEINGNVYIDGDMFVTNFNNPGDLVINGDVYCTGTIYLGGNALNNNNQNQIFKGKVYAAGGIMGADGIDHTADVSGAADPSTLGPWASETGDSCKFNAEVSLNNRSDEEKAKDGYKTSQSRNVVLSLPYSPTSDTSNEDQTVQKEFSVMPEDDEYGAYDPNAADTDNPGKSGAYVYYEPEVALQNVSGTSAKLKLKVNSGTPILNCLQASKTFTESDGSTVTLNNVIVPPAPNGDTGLCEMTLKASDFQNNSNKYYIDASNGTCIQIELSGEMDSATPTFVVYGDGAVYFTIPKENGSKFSMQTFNVMSYEVEQELMSGNTFYLGYNYDDEHQMDPDMGPTFPRIYMFVDKGVTYENRNINGIFTGLIDAPYSTVSYSGNHGKSLKWLYDLYGDFKGLSAFNASDVQFGGSLIVDELDTQNKYSAIKFRDDAESDSGSSQETSMITWKRQRYLSRK